MLITRVANTDITWNKDLQVNAPRVSPHFDLTLDDKSVLRAINQLNFIQMKRKNISFSYISFYFSSDLTSSVLNVCIYRIFVAYFFFVIGFFAFLQIRFASKYNIFYK